MNQIQIGKFIAKLRKEKQITQEQLAEKLGINNRTVSRWENGKSMPDLSLFKPLCQELGISINELLEGEKTSSQQNNTLENNIFTAIDYNKEKLLKKEIYYHLFIIIFGLLILIMAMSIIPNSINFVTWYTILGTYILLIVSASFIKFIIDKNKTFKYLIIIAFSFFIILFTMIYILDFINVFRHNIVPHVNTTPHITSTAVVYDTLFYDVYDCEPTNSHNKLLIKPNSRNIYDKISKYCQ